MKYIKHIDGSIWRYQKSKDKKFLKLVKTQEIYENNRDDAVLILEEVIKNMKPIKINLK